MKTKASDNAKLGLFVLAGAIFLILTLYMVGKNRNIFGSTFTIKASMNTVNGLMPGNNVRYRGIDVGTVKDIVLVDDTAIFVIMVIDKNYKSSIRQNAIASIGTDGLMGNKVININTQNRPAPSVEEGSVILSREPIETDEMLRTLNTTNNTIERVTRNLDEITLKLNTSNSLWNLLADTVITHDLKKAVKDFSLAGAHTARLTADVKEMVGRYNQGGGLVETLFTDSTLIARLDDSFRKIQTASEKTALMMESLELVINNMKAGEGTAGLILSDTVLRSTMMESAVELEQGVSRFNENMEALKSNFLFRRYFKKMEKERVQRLKEKGPKEETDSTVLTNRK